MEESLKNRLRVLRAELGWSQAALAKRLEPCAEDSRSWAVLVQYWLI
jgi:hypothetical protein